ncbi:ABC transporter substrate-binding protein [Lacticaseibacillus thailandensis]|uniref:ABC transporter periplasmic protein n=1 Tax=Lacticaseibacillus thailandensis DSM 22698 = JCM 13996 TaxID=1423810 RepID=A0A0R2C5R1_9LACO|nr:ABC transporter substrate-binding protein [Lacticaseibacillus thailandensis]KRM86624.1 ABC transporter periplasmic protein [Lacticaseibacillus thailandensis DSM 22698 = JCM 13996]
MKKLAKIMTTTVAVAAITLLAACGKKTAQADTTTKTVKIGILQQINQTALDDARKGFIAELAKHGYKQGKNLKLDYLNAQGDQSNLKTMSQRLAKDDNTLNLAIATSAAQSLQQADTKTPLLFTAITDPKSAGLTTNLKQPDKNATGVTDMVNVAGQIKLLRRLVPKAKTVGLLYNAAEANSVMQIKLARAALKAQGMHVVTKTVASTNDVAQTTQVLAKHVDAIYVPADNTVAAAMATVGKVSAATKTPVVPAASTMVQAGGTATNGISYKELGRQTARMALKTIKGQQPKQLAVEAPAKVSVVVNRNMMKKLNIPVSRIK